MSATACGSLPVPDAALLERQSVRQYDRLVGSEGKKKQATNDRILSSQTKRSNGLLLTSTT